MPYKTKGKAILEQKNGKWVKIAEGKTPESAKASVRARYAAEGKKKQ